MKRVIVIGGGITGLTAANDLQKQNDIQLTLLEAGDRLGGKIQTLQKNGFTIERGPDSFLSRKKSATLLAEELGIDHLLVPNATGQSYILVKNKLHPMPTGSFMGIPTRVRPFLFSGLFSPAGKVRAAMDLVKSSKEVDGDQSLGLFFRRRLGNQVVDHLIEPLLSGIYAGNMNELSLKATFPQFYDLEQEHGSLIKGLRKTTTPKRKNSPKPSMFRTFQGGLQTLVDAIEESFPEGVIKKKAKVDHIEKKGHHYHLLLSDGQVMEADAIIMAVPHFAAQRMLTQYDFLQPLREKNATSVANVAMAFDESAIKQDINGTGFVVSRTSDFRITACTWTHKKWPNSTPDGKVLLRCYVGKPDDQAVVSMSDEEIVQIALKDLNRIMNISDQPEFSVVTRWYDGMPQYRVGHLERMKTVEEHLAKELPGVFLAGASYYGIGLPDCIDQGHAAAEKVLEHVTGA